MKSLDQCKADLKAAYKAFLADKTDEKYNLAIKAKNEYLACVQFQAMSVEKIEKGLSEEVIAELNAE